MFEMFRKRRQYRKLADLIGQETHRQLLQALNEKSTVLGTADEIAFTSAYLRSFTFVAFSEIGCEDVATHLKYIRHFCNGVLPSRLWDVFQRGESLNALSQDGEREEFKKTRESYDLGVEAGISDAGDFLNNGVLPKKLTDFLCKCSVERAGS